MIEELQRVALTMDPPEHRLRSGDIGTVVMVHDHGRGFEVEFVALSGETLAVATVGAAMVRRLGPREIANARAVA